jgi:hypothetical protein
MNRGPAIVARLPVLPGMEPREDREDVEDPACDSYTESRDDETVRYGRQGARWLSATILSSLIR